MVYPLTSCLSSKGLALRFDWLVGPLVKPEGMGSSSTIGSANGLCFWSGESSISVTARDWTDWRDFPLAVPCLSVVEVASFFELEESLLELSVDGLRSGDWTVTLGVFCDELLSERAVVVEVAVVVVVVVVLERPPFVTLIGLATALRATMELTPSLAATALALLICEFVMAGTLGDD